MKYITSKNIKLNSGTVVTVGNFDGVHKGHLDLINSIKSLKKDKYTDCQTVVLSFNPHPIAYLKKMDFRLIFSRKERIHVFENLDIDILIEYPFDKNTKNMTKDEFVEGILLNKLNCKALVVGKDWGFGKNKQGNAYTLKEMLKKHGVEVIIRDSILYSGEKLGSTNIRNLISNGCVETANKLLGKQYFVIGEVVVGKQLGRQIGFPTMNIYPPNDKLLPPNGVYVSNVFIDDEKFYAVTNIGVNPTVDGDELIVESHIFDFDREIYGKIAKVEILKQVRLEKKFNSLDELKAQIARDILQAKKYLNI